MVTIVFPTVDARGQKEPICRVGEKGAQVLLCRHRRNCHQPAVGMAVMSACGPVQTSTWRIYIQAHTFSIYPEDSPYDALTRLDLIGNNGT